MVMHRKREAKCSFVTSRKDLPTGNYLQGFFHFSANVAEVTYHKLKFSVQYSSLLDLP